MAHHQKYVRAICNFLSLEPGDLGFVVGDVLLVTGAIDSNWLTGKNLSQTELVSGIFPANFVEDLVVPSIGAEECLFVAKKSFSTDVEGDLSFVKGDIIIGIEQVDDNWWQGQVERKFGIFPLNHVRLLPPLSCATEQVLKSEEKAVLVSDSQGSIVNGDEQLEKTLEKHNTETNKVADNGKVLAKARAISDLTAQLHDELSFKVGEVIEIIDVIDSDFAVGRSDSGAVGQFPLAFVQVVEGSISSYLSSRETNRLSAKFDWWKDPSAAAEYLNKQIEDTLLMVQPSFEDQTAPISTDDDQYSVNSSHQFYLSSSSHLTDCYLAQPGVISTKAGTSVRAVFPFVAENDNELSLVVGDVITVIGAVDDQWMEGSVDDRRGIFPLTYVEVLSCDESEEPNGDVREDLSESCRVVDGISAHNNASVESERHVESSVEVEGMNEPPTISSKPFSYHTHDVVLDSNENEWPGGNLTANTAVLQSGGELSVVSRSFSLDNIQNLPDSHEQVSTVVNSVSFPSDLDTVATESHSQLPFLPCQSADQAAETVTVTDQVTTDNDFAQELTVSAAENDGEGKRDIVIAVQSDAISVSSKPAVTVQKPQLKPKPVFSMQPVMAEKLTTVQRPPRPEQRPVMRPVTSVQRGDEVVAGSECLPPCRPLRPVAADRRTTASSKPAPLKAKPSIVNRSQSQPGACAALTSSTNSSILESMQGSSSAMASAGVGDQVDNMVIVQGDMGISAIANLGLNSTCPPPPNLSPAINRRGQKSAKSVSFDCGLMSSAASNDCMHKATEGSSFTNDSLQSTSEESIELKLRAKPERQVGMSVFYADLVPKRPQAAARILPPTERQSQSVIDERSRRVPRRPAPPRPTNVAGCSLKGLACLVSSSQEDADAIENRQLVADLERRISQVENDLESCRRSKADLEKQLTIEESADDNETNTVSASEIMASIEFYDANITGLTNEQQQLMEDLKNFVPSRPAHNGSQQKTAQQYSDEQNRKLDLLAMKHKRRETRERVVEELVQTEHDYLQSLCVCLEVFFAGSTRSAPPSVDLEVLFGNMFEVVELSQRIVSYLEANVTCKPFDEQIIGRCFTSFREDLKKVYSVYCRNHDDVIALLDGYKANSDAQDYFSYQLDMMRQHQPATFDLGSILIKPVQRILKYPLLLNELLKSTDEQHVDYVHVTAAVQAITDVAHAINEYKRRKDLVFKYKKTSEVSFGELLSRINLHSTWKKLNRFSMRMVGVQTIDERFDREESKFNVMVEYVTALVSDTNQYTSKLQDSIVNLESVTRNFAEMFGEQSTAFGIDRLFDACRQIASVHFPQLKSNIDTAVIPPLNSLVLLFQGPIKVVKKRYDKLLDYESATMKLKNARDPEQTKALQSLVQTSRADYEAMNAQLLEDLPQLYTASLSIVSDCLCRLVRAIKLFHGSSYEVFANISQLAISVPADANEIGVVSWFLQRHTEIINAMSDSMLIPKQFFLAPADEQWGPHSPALKERKSSEPAVFYTDSLPLESNVGAGSLLQNYPSNKLFQTTQNVTASQPLDLTLTSGTVVAVIKEGDPMGNKDRYFVDSGSQKGFVSRRYLVPHVIPGQKSEHATVFAGSSSYGSDIRKTSPGSYSKDLDLLSPLASASNAGTSTIDDYSKPVSSAASAFSTDKASVKQQLSSSTSLNTNTNTTLKQSHSPASFRKSDTSLKQTQSTPTGRKSDTLPCTSSAGAYYSPTSLATTLQENSQQQFQHQQQQASVYTSELPSYEQLVSGTSGRSVPGRTVTNIELYQAVYQYTANSSLELSLAEGQIVCVQAKQDLEGNQEWWLVSTPDGHQGYVPANYLYQIQPR